MLVTNLRFKSGLLILIKELLGKCIYICIHAKSIDFMILQWLFMRNGITDFNFGLFYLFSDHEVWGKGFSTQNSSYP